MCIFFIAIVSSASALLRTRLLCSLSDRDACGTVHDGDSLILSDRDITTPRTEMARAGASGSTAPLVVVSCVDFALLASIGYHKYNQCRMLTYSVGHSHEDKMTWALSCRLNFRICSVA